VTVQPSYLPERSSAENRQFFWSYTVVITNSGDETVRLRTRHWVITDASGRTQEVRGEGVVGEQPHLKPGEGYRYSSWTVIETPVGAMQGSYQMIGDDGARFDAPIGAFRLAKPGLLH